jgi:hypothetical protein
LGYGVWVGKEKGMMEYPKIETLYERDEKTHRIKPELILKNPVYGDIRTWFWTEKIDGTNIRATWVPASGDQPESLTFGGRTDNAQIHADLYKYLQDNIPVGKMREEFPESPIVIYGEGYGAGIQKGGGDYSFTKKFIVFDVFVLDPTSKLGGWWLNWANVCDVASKLGLDVVPTFPEMTLEQASEFVRGGFTSHIGVRPAEGLVGRTREALFDKKGHRLIVKLKTKDF